MLSSFYGALAASGAADAPAYIRADGTRAIDVVKADIVGALAKIAR